MLGYEELSLNSMKFGSEEDFRVAITELKWVMKTFGKATRKDFERISSKYHFPIGFLKQGLKGLSSPDDYRISKSKWFPVLYSWKNQRRQISYELLRRQIDYRAARFSLIRTFAVLSGISSSIIMLLTTNFSLNLLDLTLLMLTFGLFLVELLFEMKSRLSDKKAALDIHCYRLKHKGLGSIIEENERFLRSIHKFVIYAGNALKRKLESPLEMTIFKAHVEKGTLVVEDGEDPNLEYQKRIFELSKA